MSKQKGNWQNAIADVLEKYQGFWYWLFHRILNKTWFEKDVFFPCISLKQILFMLSHTTDAVLSFAQ